MARLPYDEITGLQEECVLPSMNTTDISTQTDIYLLLDYVNVMFKRNVITLNDNHVLLNVGTQFNRPNKSIHRKHLRSYQLSGDVSSCLSSPDYETFQCEVSSLGNGNFKEDIETQSEMASSKFVSFKKTVLTRRDSIIRKGRIYPKQFSNYDDQAVINSIGHSSKKVVSGKFKAKAEHLITSRNYHSTKNEDFQTDHDTLTEVDETTGNDAINIGRKPRQKKMCISDSETSSLVRSPRNSNIKPTTKMSDAAMNRNKAEKRLIQIYGNLSLLHPKTRKTFECKSSSQLSKYTCHLCKKGFRWMSDYFTHQMSCY